MKKKFVICMCIIGIIILVLVGITLYSVWKKTNNNDINSNTIKNEKIEITIQNIKKDKSKDLIYQADYSVKGLEEAWYYCNTLDKERSINDIKVPYINIDSKDANNANAELKSFFDETAGYFKEEYDKTYNTNDEYDEILFSYTCDYKYYINNNVLSICVRQESSGTNVPDYNYLTYNFDLKTGAILSFENIFTLIGFSNEEVNEKAKKVIENYSEYVYFKETEIEAVNTINEYIKYDIKKYEDKDFKFYLDKKGVLNLIIELKVAAGGGFYKAILPIHKEDSKNNYELHKMRETTGELYVKHNVYEYHNMEDSWYTLDVEGGKVHDFNTNVMAPYINVNSNDAREANKEIKYQFEKVAQMFEDEILSSELISKTLIGLDYTYCILDNLLSVVLKETIINYDELKEISTYYTYNFDLSTGKRLSYKELLENMGYNEDELDKNILHNIKQNSNITCYEGEEYNNVLDRAIKNYKATLNSNEMKASINYNEGISVYLKLATPEYYEFSELELIADNIQNTL